MIHSHGIDIEESPLTIWGCLNGQYGAYEDESKERICPKCGKHTDSFMKDDDNLFWWCSSCNKIEII